MGDFYHHKGSNAAAANRLGALVDQYPLYSQADEALWEEADSYSQMGPRFRAKEGDTLAKLVRDYPLSPLPMMAKKKLESLEMAVPEADPAAVARMKYEIDNRTKPGLIHRAVDMVRRGPDVSSAAKSGTPTMVNPKPAIPASVPAACRCAGRHRRDRRAGDRSHRARYQAGCSFESAGIVRQLEDTREGFLIERDDSSRERKTHRRLLARAGRQDAGRCRRQSQSQEEQEKEESRYRRTRPTRRSCRPIHRNLSNEHYSAR